MVLDIGVPETLLLVLFLIIRLMGICVLAYLAYLAVKALRAYIASAQVREQKALVRRSLGETIRAYRVEHGMTQEFVAEALGVSRQAVSKWESGASDPSTFNLIALAKLFGVNAAEMLEGVEPR